jgi:LemA protein
VAREYNTTRRTFPTNIIASIFNFGEKPYFQAQEGADKAPKVDFGTSN